MEAVFDFENFGGLFFPLIAAPAGAEYWVSIAPVSTMLSPVREDFWTGRVASLQPPTVPSSALRVRVSHSLFDRGGVLGRQCGLHVCFACLSCVLLCVDGTGLLFLSLRQCGFPGAILSHRFPCILRLHVIGFLLHVTGL